MLTDAQYLELVKLISEGSEATLETALRQVEAHIASEMDDWRLYLLQGDIFKRRNNPLEALKAFTIAAKAGGSLSPFVWFEAAAQHHKIGQTDEAIRAFRLSLHCDNNRAETHNAIGKLLYLQGKSLEALPHGRWLMFHGTTSDHFNTANYIFRTNNLSDDAFKAAHRAHELTPNNWNAVAVYMQAAQLSCNWDVVATLSEKIDRELYEAGRWDEELEMHLVHITRCMDERINLTHAIHKAKQNIKALPQFDHSSHKAEDKIKIGYVSADLRNHAILHLVSGIFRFHDKNKYEITVYCHSPKDEGPFRKKFEQEAQQIVLTSSMTDEELAQHIYDDGIDILVDLMGFTDKQRLEVFAMRPAPIQVTWLGYPGTSGADFFDYVIADHTVIPDESRQYYSEKVCRLPDCYQPNDLERVVATQVPSRRELGLPPKGFVFASFNQHSKIDRASFALWMSILKDVPHSVLWLLDPGESGRKALTTHARRFGIDPVRLVFAERVPVPLHLSRLRCADLMLDCLIYNGHTTTSDALWVGTPVITTPGTHFASRVAASLLRACGMDECILPDAKAVHDFAVNLASSKSACHMLKSKLKENRLIKPLYDTERFTRHLEQAFERMLKKYKAGIAPEHFDVPALPERTAPFVSGIVERQTQVLDPRTDTKSVIQMTQCLQVAYGVCPLCHSDALKAVCDEHLRFSDTIPANFPDKAFWLQCMNCHHVHTRYYWIDESKTQMQNVPAVNIFTVSQERERAAIIINAVKNAFPRHEITKKDDKTKWFDILPASPCLAATTLEYGFSPTTIVESEALMQRIEATGPRSINANFLTINIKGNPDVISLVDTLECAPMPLLLLYRAHNLLIDGGILVIVASNISSAAWKDLRALDRITKMGHPLVHHLYSSTRIFDFLDETGFKVVDYTALPTGEAEMCIIARKIKK